MEGLKALAQRMGIDTRDEVLLTHGPVPSDEHLTFVKDIHGEEYGFRLMIRNPDILECFYFRWKTLGSMPVSETHIVTDDSAGISLNGVRAAIIYRKAAKGRKINAKLFTAPSLHEGYADMPEGYSGFKPEPVVLAGGLIVVRRFKGV